ncbi:MAG: 6,7-dimethyl-8-ribityllumazine synthase [Planctomycetes bacterium]|nr:6,7-dimethyl-8-ribityllumazine synthase [Planctomycetota bacterium]
MARIRTVRSRGRRARYCVLASRFNRPIVDRLVEGARGALRKAGARGSDIDLVWVPGAFELPLAAQEVARSGAYRALVCVGAVIRGETPHFDFVAAEAARGLAEVSRRERLPVGFGVLTTDTPEQAVARAGGPHGNRGADAAAAALEMAEVMERLSTSDF